MKLNTMQPVLTRWSVTLHDLLWVPVAVVLAYWFRFNLGSIPDSYHEGIVELLVAAVPVHAFAFWMFGCYRGIWRFASLPDILRIGKAVVSGALLVGVAMFIYDRFEGLPRSVVILYPILLFMGVITSRVLYRAINTHRLALDRGDRERALIIGAGRAGDLLARDLLDHGPFLPVVMLDDDRRKRGTELHGIRVVGPITDLAKIVDAYQIDTVLVAMPSAPRKVMDDIVRHCAEKHVNCRTLPSMLELADGRVEVSRLRPVTVEDLLGREPVKLDEAAIDAYLTGKTVIVTGGGGSIGSELCRQVLAHKPRQLVIVESSEFNLYQIEKELASLKGSSLLVPALVDVRIAESVENVFATFRPDVVFHAAAYKHVPMVEENVVAGIRNNVLGTRIVADAAVKFKASRFVLVSTDKTVNPTNIMGATKRIAEIYCQTLNGHVDTHFITTRFGNVLGSAGSVVPLFQQQIAKGGPITVTHPDITRFFMTIPEASSLILQAGAMGRGGEIFVLDMGKPVKIKDLAENLIRLSGLKPDVDIKIEYVGLRPGEKMHEELFYSKEELLGTGHPKLMQANCWPHDWVVLEGEIFALEKAVRQFDETAAIICIKRLVPELNRYIPPEREKQDKLAQTDPQLRVIK